MARMNAGAPPVDTMKVAPIAGPSVELPSYEQPMAAPVPVASGGLNVPAEYNPYSSQGPTI